MPKTLQEIKAGLDFLSQDVADMIAAQPKPPVEPPPKPEEPKPPVEPPPPVQPSKVLVGVYRNDVPGMPGLASYEAWLGRPLDMIQGHAAKEEWSDVEGEDWQLQPYGQWVNAKPGRVLNYSMPPFPNGKGTLADAAVGKYDASYKKLADNLVRNKLQNTIIRIGWEMSIPNQMPWASNGREAQFAGAFRRIVQMMRTAQPNAGFKFDWNPNYDANDATLTTAYPGNEFVDYIGIDIYDQGWDGQSYPIPASATPEEAQRRWKTIWDKQFGWRLENWTKFAKSKGKKLSVPEWGLYRNGTTNGGGDNIVFVKGMLDWIYNPDNNVGYHSYFDSSANSPTAQAWDQQLSDTLNNGSRVYKTQFPNAAKMFQDRVRAGK